jgi:hypothetical protein
MPYCLSNFIFLTDDNYLYLILLVVKVQFFDGYGYHGTSFEQTYRCYPASFIEKVKCLHLNETFHLYHTKLYALALHH